LAQLKNLRGEIAQQSMSPLKAPWSPTIMGALGFVSLLTLRLTTRVPKDPAEPQSWILRWSKRKSPPEITLSAAHLSPGQPLLGFPPAAAPGSR